MYTIYLLINEFNTKTYTGFTEDVNQRLMEHKNKKAKSTKLFGNFRHIILERDIATIEQARLREKYWKSCAGRKKIKNSFNMALSSSG